VRSSVTKAIILVAAGVSVGVLGVALWSVRHNSAFTHAQRGNIYAHKGSRREALVELEKASSMVAPGDIETEQQLGDAYATLGELPQMVEHCERYLTLARERGADPNQLEAFEKFLVQAKERLTPTYFTNSPPQDYTTESFAAALRQRLNPDELAVAVDPLAVSPEMNHRAHELIAKATNDLEKATLLFHDVIRHVKNDSLLPEKRYLTAQESFDRLKQPDGWLHCQDATFLYVAMARAVGLRAYTVDVYETCDGTRTLHSCASVFVERGCLLVDPAYYWFGAPHKSFRILDDVQNLGAYLCVDPDLKQNLVASKLAPDLPLVQYNLCRELTDLQRWSEVASSLPLLQKVDSVGALAAQIQADLAIHEGRLDAAVGYLLKAVEIDPHQFYTRAQLGKIYVVQGKSKEALAAYQQALLCPHTETDAEAIARAVSETTAKDR
jgi:tetratricopeptide (TPR) repeat protein